MSGHILCLQETHGLPYEVLTELGTLLPGWCVLHSSCQDVHGIGAGGRGGLLFSFALRLLSFVISTTSFWSQFEFIKSLVIFVVDSLSLLRRFLPPRIGILKFSMLTARGLKELTLFELRRELSG